MCQRQRTTARPVTARRTRPRSACSLRPERVCPALAFSPSASAGPEPEGTYVRGRSGRIPRAQARASFSRNRGNSGLRPEYASLQAESCFRRLRRNAGKMRVWRHVRSGAGRSAIVPSLPRARIDESTVRRPRGITLQGRATTPAEAVTSRLPRAALDLRTPSVRLGRTDDPRICLRQIL